MIAQPASAFATPRSRVPQAIRGNLGNEELQQMLQEVEAVLDDDAQVGICVLNTRVASSRFMMSDIMHFKQIHDARPDVMMRG